MSKFSVYLKGILNQRGEPISRIAKNTGLERTSIHKALNDERLLPYTSLRRLCQYLQLTLPQMRELNQYYDILLQGEDTYRIRQEIMSLLSSLSQLHFACRGLYSNPDSIQSDQPMLALIYGRPQVEAAIRAVIQSETMDSGTPPIALYLPPDSLDAAGLFQLWRSGRQFSVRQLVSFLPQNTGTSSRQENLALLKQLLPLSLVSGGQYFAYFYFEQTSALSVVDPMPYFIITSRYLIRLDSKLSVAHFETCPQMIELYQKHFSQMLEECQLLNSYSNDLEQILASYMRGTDSDSYYTIMTQPCLGHYYTRERIQQHFRQDIPQRDALIDLSDQRFARLRNLEGEYYTIFTEEGLHQLATTGIAADLPPELVLPIDRQTRLEMFRSFREDIESGRIKGCIADIEKLPIPPYLTLTCDPRFGVHIYATQGFIEGAYACNLHLEESGMGEAFSDFIRSLPDSKYVYPTERTLEILDELIEYLSMKPEEICHD